MRRDSVNDPIMPFLLHPAYQNLRKAISEDAAPLVLVVGSGLSRSEGYPDWKGLRTSLETSLRMKRDAELSADPKYDVSAIENTLATHDYWDFFRDAKVCLTRPTFNQIIRDILGKKNTGEPSSDANADAGLRALSPLAPKGIVTLNLDPTAGNIFSELNPGSMAIPIYGFDLNRKWHLINDEKRFLVYLHGHIEEPNTWVLGRDELDALTKLPAHKLFLTNLFLNNIVLFVGISADDVAISAPLMSLRDSEIDANRVFWFTSRSDANTREWAARSSVQIIPYAAHNADAHNLALKTLVDDIRHFQPRDAVDLIPQIKEVDGSRGSLTKIDPDELAQKPPEDVRNYLSRFIDQELSAVPDDNKYEVFSSIVSEFDYPIQTRSFYRGVKNREFFGYTLSFPPLGMGNFGTVYHARDRDDKDVAVKIMHSTILQMPEMVGGFRRGSRSMKILRDNDINGVVAIKDSYEMPPTVVMEFVQGNSIQELFDISSSIPWIGKLRIINSASEIVDGCHKLDDIVLHRDLKPSNIMITGLDYDTYEFERVTILDFDMSWHKGSSEKDVVFESRDDFGYLAPEQTDPSIIETSRSTKVDSFGLGMTFLSILRAKHPIPNMSLSADFERAVRSASRQGYNLDLRCMPNRVARLIVDATKHFQDDRIAFNVFRLRMRKIYEACSKKASMLEHDIFCEELIARLADGREYSWDDIEDKGQFSLIGGIVVSASVDELTLGVKIDISYQDAGAKQYHRRNELIGASRTALEKACRENGFKINKININHGAFESSVLIERAPTKENIDVIKRSLMPSIQYLLQID